MVAPSRGADSRLRAEIILSALLAILCLTRAPAAADQYVFVRKFDKPGLPSLPGGFIDRFGGAIAAVGNDRLLAGAIYDDTAATDAGAAYLIDVATGALLQTFTRPSGAASEDRFGDAVAALGDDALVGAPKANDGSPLSGVVYLFDSTTGAVLLTLHNPAPAVSPLNSGDQFGASIAAFGDDILGGAPYEDGPAADGGVVYLFDGTSGALLHTFTSPNPHANEHFGVAVAAYGTTVVVGAPESVGDSGGVVYELDGGPGALLHTLAPPSGPLINMFGTHLAIVGTNVLASDSNAGAGAQLEIGAAALYDGPTGAMLRYFVNPTPVQFASNAFGQAIAGIGNDVFVSDTLDQPDHSGSVFRFDATTGALLQTITQPGHSGPASFGASSATIGSSILIGATTASNEVTGSPSGAVYLFASCGNGVQELGQACDDGNLTDGDGCDSNCTPTACGNGIVTAGETCDDGNLLGADCCTALCAPDLVGAPCDDGNPGTVLDQCSASGACEGLPPGGIPTLSQWGVLLLSILILTRILMLSRRQRVSERR